MQRQHRAFHRGTVLGLIVALAVLTVCVAPGGVRAAGPAHVSPAVGAQPATDWPTYRGSAAGNSAISTGENLAVSWQSPFLKSIAIDATPYGNKLLVSGMVTTPPFTKLWGGSEYHDPFYALDIHTGKILWQTFTPNWHTRGAIVVNGIAYLGVGNSWAALARGVTWDTATRGIGPSGVYAFDVNTGRLLWTFATPGAVHNALLYHGGVIYAVTGDRAFYAIDAKTGKLDWKLSIPSYDSVSSPILAGNLVYFGGAHPYSVYAVNIDTHQIAWQRNLPGVIGATDDCTPAVANGLVYIEGVTSPPTHTFTVLPSTGTPVQEDLYALNAQTGQIVWTFHEGLGHTPFFYAASTPTVVGDSVYFGSSVTTSFYAVNARTGALRWAYQVAPQWKLPNSIGESGTVANGIVWTGTFGGLLLGLRTSDGTVVVQKHLKTSFYAGSPLVVDNTLILSSLSGFVVALSIPQLLGH